MLLITGEQLPLTEVDLDDAAMKQVTLDITQHKLGIVSWRTFVLCLDNTGGVRTREDCCGVRTEAENDYRPVCVIAYNQEGTETRR